MNYLEILNRYIWTWVFLPCFLLCGALLTWRCRGLQFRRFSLAMRRTVGRAFSKQEAEGGSLTPLQAASTALAATVGTGNIVGTAQAIAMGGPGAVFWLWAAALLGMVIKYAEIFLGLRYKSQDRSGRPVGGPMYYIRLGCGRRFAPLAGLYAALAALSALSVGNMSQINGSVRAIAGAVQAFLPLSGEELFRLRLFLGLGLALVTAAIIAGDAKRVGRAAELLVPFMSLIFIGLTAAVVICHAQRLLPALAEIVSGAFRPRAALGAASGLTLREAIHWGVRRGAFSNEAGLGSAAIAHAATDAPSPAEHGLWGVFEVFADTIVICTATALAILCSGVEIPWGTIPGPELLGAAFGTVFGRKGAFLIMAVSLSLFAFSTVIGCSVYGLRGVEFLCGESAGGVYRLLYTVCVLLGSIMSTSFVWMAADTVNVLMAVPNFVALFLLSGQVARAANEQFFDRPLFSSRQ